MKIRLENLTKVYPSGGRRNRSEVTAVSRLSYEIPDGELVGLLGPSGCGKSTTLNLICGLEKPTEGRIFFGEEDVTDLPAEKRDVGMVFQSYALYPHLTVHDIIVFPLENRKGADRLTKEQMEEKALEVARLVQIEDLMDRKPGEMSGGQQQRVAIARALVKRPRVLLLDEPLSNLDARLRLRTREEIRRIQRETGITTVFVTHDQEEAMSICDQILVMNAGVMQQSGRPQDVYDHPRNLFVARFLGNPAINVFEGRLEKGTVLLGKDAIGRMEGVPDQDLWVGIRPEGFVPDPEGPLRCRMKAVEVMGRDTTILASHDAAPGQTIRAIVDSDVRPDGEADGVHFRIKPHKCFLFSKETEEAVGPAEDGRGEKRE